MVQDESFDYKSCCESILAFMKNAPVNLFFKDTECRYRFVSDVCNMLNGGDEHSVLGKTDLEVQVYPEFGQFYYEDDLKILRTGEGSQYVSEIPTPEGTLYFDIRKNPVFHAGKIIGIVGITEDITARVQMENELKELSYHDTLTGLYNRNYLDVKKDKLIASIQLPVTVIMGDCNYLKRVNDTIGHDYGDMLIKRAARIIRATVPESCSVIRLGGDEFLILCGQTSARQAQELIQRVQSALKAGSDDRLDLSVAFGFHTTEEGAFDLHAAYHLADQDMYQNKHRDRIPE